MTDRLFIAELVREIGPMLLGSRVRAIREETPGPTVSLSLNAPAPSVLRFHLGSPAPGLFRHEVEPESRKPTPREAKLTKWLASARLVSVVQSELDRVVRVELEQTRLSGRKKSIGLVFEITGARASLFVVDRETNNIVDCFSRGGPRLSPGERFVELAPPPHASLPARDYAEVEKRLAETEATGKEGLLVATGWTPLLVKELRCLMDDRGESLRAAFESVRDRLHTPHAVLFVAPRAERDRKPAVLLSPIPLECQRGRETIDVTGFEHAMAEAVRLSVRTDKERVVRHRLDSALTRRLKKSRSLSAKLLEQERTLPEPGELRRKGETLLAGMGGATRVSETTVRLPDPFDPDGGVVELVIDPRLDLAANAERLFRRSRKAERTRDELAGRIAAVRRELEHAEAMALDLGEAQGLEELESLEREAEEQGVVSETKERPRSRARTERLPPREFVTPGGFVVLVGRSARSNEDVTFRHARPHDLWFHASRIPGSHVVLKIEASAPDEDDILRAAALAARFSKSRHDSRVEVMMTERRNVSKIKGSPPGLVRVEKFTTLRVKPADDRDTHDIR